MLTSAVVALVCVGQVEADPPRWLFTAAARTRPAGGLIGAQALFDAGTEADLQVGGYLNYFYYWAEMGAHLQWRYLDGFIVSGLWLGVEPGDFLAVDRRDERRPGLRAVLRGRVEVNYRPEGAWYWLYSRSTVDARTRNFTEFDPFRELVVDEELTFEQALAPMVRVATVGDSVVWGYIEGTVSAEVRAGLVDLRPSVGVIWEDLLPGVIVDLDVYYGLRKDTVLEGLGVLLFVWWRM